LKKRHLSCCKPPEEEGIKKRRSKRTTLLLPPEGVRGQLTSRCALAPLEKMRSEGSKFAEGKLMGKE